MLNVTRDDVRDVPFPHICKQGIIPEELFVRLKADFPKSAHFSDEFATTGSTGSRVGAGTGFDIYRGDAAYNRLIERSEAWREFDAFINSPRFVEIFLKVFEDDLEALGCSVEVQPDAYDPAYIEPRETLTSKPTLRNRMRAFLPKAKFSSKKFVPLFTRLDIERSLSGYRKQPHCDRENRLCSLIIYFNDLKAEGIEGGELQVFAHKVEKPPYEHERHPKPEDVVVAATIDPRANLGVFFPCSSNSYHGVNPVLTKDRARDFLYINISAVTADCW